MPQKMLRKYVVFILILHNTFPFGSSTSLLCGRTKELELGSGGASGGAGAALALALLRPAPPPAHNGTCQLKLVAPNATAFALRLIDVKESMSEWERDGSGMYAPGPGRKWGARGLTPAQDTTEHTGSNNTDACKLLVYVGNELKTPMWRLPLCGGNAAALAARAGTILLPPKIRVVWNPPTSPYQHTDKLRLVVTAVNSGNLCNNRSAQFPCGATGLCVAAYLACDDVRHCPGGEDEDLSWCARRRVPPLLEVFRRFAARNQEFLGLDPATGVTKPSVIMKINDTEQKTNVLAEFGAALKPYGPWSYLVVGMLICITVLMFCFAWECCCKRSKPSATPLSIPTACLDLSPTVSVTASSQHTLLTSPPSPPASPPQYEPPPTYSSLFPRAFKSSPTPMPHCSHQEPPD